MRVRRVFKYKDEAWDYVFLESNPSLGRTILDNFMWHIVDMGYETDNNRTVPNGDYSIRIQSGKEVSLGLFSGRCFKGVIETEEGMTGLSVLLMGPNKALMN